MRQVIFDTETTGLSPADGHRIIEIGCVELIDGGPTGRTFHHYCNPGRPVEAGAVAVHGLTDDFLEDKPAFADIADALAAFFEDAELVAHNAPFDVGFLDAEFQRLGRPPLDPARIVDTLALARARFPGARNDLDSLCDRFDISRAERTMHGALLDARLTALVFIELTGGRQRRLELAGLDADPSNENGPITPTARARSRPVPLAPRLSEAERDAHDRFLADLGAQALWLRGRAVN